MALWDVFLMPWPPRAGRTPFQRACQLMHHKKVHRILVISCCVVAYARLRSWLAGDHLVRIYRKVSFAGTACVAFHCIAYCCNIWA